MTKSILFTLLPTLLAGLFLPLCAEAKRSEYPASFQVNGQPTSTVKEFITRLQSLYPSVKTQQSNAPSTEYRGQKYEAMEIKTKGLLFDSKVEQTLTYIQLHSGLWRMLYVEGRTCIKGESLENGQWVLGWKCREIQTPLTGAFSDIYLIENLETDVAALSRAWAKKVEARKAASPQDTTEKPKEKFLTLGDLKETILDFGGTWKEEASTWTNYSNTASEPALKIHVTTTLGEFSVSQSFLYIFDGDLLILKEIDGKFCRFIERVDKEICDSNHDMAYTPTRVTPFPIKLRNSHKPSAPTTPSDTDANDAALLPCGNLRSNYEMALRVHFENSTFGVKVEKMHASALLRLPVALDPLGLFTSRESISEFVTNSLVNNIRMNIEKGSAGECSPVRPLLDSMRKDLLNHTINLNLFLERLKKVNYRLGRLTSPNEIHKKMTAFVSKFVQGSPLGKNNPQAAVEVAAAKLKKYFRRGLDLLAAPEELLTSAYLKLDAYSVLLPEPLIAQKNITIIGNSSEKKYFGLSVSKGIIDHYIVQLHPHIKKISKLRVGDKILRVNGVRASTLSAKELDAILLNQSRSLVLEIQKKEEVYTFVLNASPLDMMKLFYTITLKKDDSKGVVVKIRINEFHAGLGKSLREELQTMLKGISVKGYILDLQSNPGGNVDDALSVANLFIRKGPLSYYRLGARDLSKVKVLEADENMALTESIPLIVLVNEKTASSAEILAATLKAYKRALLVGTQTFGKLVAQTYMPSPLSDGRPLMMLITSTEYYDPNGKSLNGKGVLPDIVTSSLKHSKFEDGNRAGKDFAPEILLASFTPLLNASKLADIQKSVVLNKTSPEDVASLILSQTPEGDPLL